MHHVISGKKKLEIKANYMHVPTNNKKTRFQVICLIGNNFFLQVHFEVLFFFGSFLKSKTIFKLLS
jgi:hypothetical protein